MTTQVLVIDPDENFRDNLRTFMQRQQIGMSVLYGTNGLELRLMRETPSLILMRHDSCHVDGIGALRSLRENGHSLPVIIVSRSDETVDKVLAFEVGANDYLVDPFDPHELLARVRHALRCKIQWQNAPQKSVRYKFDEFELDTIDKTLFRSGVRVAASPLVIDVLSVFVSNRLRLLSRECILNQLDRNSQLHVRSLDVIVFRLRKLLGSSPEGRQYIQTRYKKGYVFCPDDELGTVTGHTTVTEKTNS